MSAIKLSTSALRPITARRIVPAATARTTAPAFTQIRSVSSNGDELGGVKGSEPATKPNRYNVCVPLYPILCSTGRRDKQIG